MSKQKPVPPFAARDGVTPSRVWCPRGPWVYLIDFLVTRFPHVPPTELARRLENGDIADSEGLRQNGRSFYQADRWLWYFREVEAETPVPFPLEILFADQDLIAVDKPHFLATTPGGRYVQETALTRVRQHFDDPDIAPLHRLDRDTAGVLLFSRQPDRRGAYQQLFQQGQVYKRYEAVAPVQASMPFPVEHRSRIEAVPGQFLMHETDGEPNSCTRISLLSQWQQADGQRWGHYQLEPTTGRKHQLRVHMSSLGLPICNDGFYPALQTQPQADDFTRPLQLLARHIAFTDPLSGQWRDFSSCQQLACIALQRRESQ